MANPKKLQILGKVGAVKTVNGVEPDENGNIVVEIPDGFSGSWDDLTEKPFYTASSEVTLIDNVTCTWTKSERPMGIFECDEIVAGESYKLYINAVLGGSNYSDELETIAYDNGMIVLAEDKAIGDYTYTAMYADGYLKITAPELDSAGSITATLIGFKNEIVQLDETFIPSSIARLTDIPEIPDQVQPDFNQNDETAADYVKGRTHWVDENEQYIISEGTLTFKSNGELYQASTSVVEYGHLDIGNTYTVVFDSTTYPDLVAFDDEGYPSIGSPYGSITNDLPFNIYTMDDGYDVLLYIETPISGDTHAISITGTMPKFHKLDERFIPDAIARKTDIPEVPEHTWESLPDKPFYEEEELETRRENETRDFSNTDDASITDLGDGRYHQGCGFNHYNLTEGERYIVIWDGTRYDVSVMLDGELASSTAYWYVGNPYLYNTSMEDNGIPFAIWQNTMYDSSGGLIVADNEVHTLSLYKVISSTIKKIDERFIPDAIARKTDIPEVPEHTWGSLPDKPFGEEVTTEIVREDAVFDFSASDFGGTWTYGSITPAYGKWAFGFGDTQPSGTYLIMLDGTSYKLDVCTTDKFKFADYGSYYIGNPAFIDADSEDNGLPFIFVQDMMYDSQSALVVTDTETHTVSLYKVTGSTINKIDPKFLPDDIGGGSNCVFVINGTETEVEDGSYGISIDKTYDEIVSAYEARKIVQVVDPYNSVYRLSYYDESAGEFCFSSMGVHDSVWCQYVRITSNNECILEYNEKYSGTVVNVRMLGSHLSTSYPYDQILSDIDSGMNVVVSYEDKYYNLDFVGECEPELFGVRFSRFATYGGKEFITITSDRDVKHDFIPTWGYEEFYNVFDETLTFEAGSVSPTTGSYDSPFEYFDVYSHDIIAFWDDVRYVESTYSSPAEEDVYIFGNTVAAGITGMISGKNCPIGIKFSVKEGGKLNVLLANAPETEETHTLRMYVVYREDMIPEEYIPNSLPEVTTENNGAFLRVVDGVPTWVSISNAEEGTF